MDFRAFLLRRRAQIKSTVMQWRFSLCWLPTLVCFAFQPQYGRGVPTMVYSYYAPTRRRTHHCDCRLYRRRGFMIAHQNSCMLFACIPHTIIPTLPRASPVQQRCSVSNLRHLRHLRHPPTPERRLAAGALVQAEGGVQQDELAASICSRQGGRRLQVCTAVVRVFHLCRHLRRDLCERAGKKHRMLCVLLQRSVSKYTSTEDGSSGGRCRIPCFWVFVRLPQSQSPLGSERTLFIVNVAVFTPPPLSAAVSYGRPTGRGDLFPFPPLLCVCLVRVCLLSAGNHAQGVALSAKKLNATAVIVMPLATPMIKVGGVLVGVRGLG